MKRTLKPLVLGSSLVLLLGADMAPDAPFGLRFARDASALIGAPLTPVSYAGVARRTTRRVAVGATAATAATASAAAAAAAQPKPPPPAAPPPPAGAPAIGTIVASLPPGCAPTPIKGVEYYNCGPGVFYRAAFQGNNLVYVATQP
ncbi:MAG TPA: hypothetical protein VJM14_01640 [Burkholderiales bacterium]|nr:hypothetical protein [Burkholderiales bacterium]